MDQSAAKKPKIHGEDPLVALCDALPPIPAELITIPKYNISVVSGASVDTSCHSSAGALLSQPDVLFCLFNAPDGTPMWIQVRRSSIPANLAESALANLGLRASLLQGSLKGMYKTLTAALDPAQVAVQHFYEQVTTTLGIHRNEADAAPFYISAMKLRQGLLWPYTRMSSFLLFFVYIYIYIYIICSACVCVCIYACASNICIRCCTSMSL